MLKKIITASVLLNLAAISAFSCPDRMFTVEGTDISINDRAVVFNASPNNTKYLGFPKGIVSEVNLTETKSTIVTENGVNYKITLKKVTKNVDVNSEDESGDVVTSVTVKNLKTKKKVVMSGESRNTSAVPKGISMPMENGEISLGKTYSYSGCGSTPTEN